MFRPLDGEQILKKISGSPIQSSSRILFVVSLKRFNCVRVNQDRWNNDAVIAFQNYFKACFDILERKQSASLPRVRWEDLYHSWLKLQSAVILA